MSICLLICYNMTFGESGLHQNYDISVQVESKVFDTIFDFEHIVPEMQVAPFVISS